MREDHGPIPTTLLCGFLGAGKTTLLRRLITNPSGKRFGVLVNDFGAINIDAELIATSDADTISLANGCICCSIQDNLVEAAQRILASNPQHLIVEASGVSRPLAICAALERPELAGRLKIDAVVCVADAEQFGNLDYASTELAIDQAVSADLLIVNKCDLASPAQIAHLEMTVRGGMPTQRIIRTSFANVPRELLTGPKLHSLGNRRDDHASVSQQQARPHDSQLPKYKHRHEHGHDHPHADEFVSWSWSCDRALDESRFRTLSHALPDSLLRAKGILRLRVSNQDRRAIFQQVGKRQSLEFEPGPPPPLSQFVAIARAGGLDESALVRQFDALTV